MFKLIIQMIVTVKHIPVPVLAISRAWEWKSFHLHILLFFYVLLQQQELQQWNSLLC